MTNEERFAALEAAVRAGVDMRVAQGLYFRNRVSETLIAAKNAEKTFDALAARALTNTTSASQPKT